MLEVLDEGRVRVGAAGVLEVLDEGRVRVLDEGRVRVVDGVVHRDVKADNVFLTADGRAVLGDWGEGMLSRVLQ